MWRLVAVSSMLAAFCLAASASFGNEQRAAAAEAEWQASGWRRMASGPNACDVRSSGAVGDNTTDDTLAVQKAIDDCRKAHPLDAVVVLTGPATYRVTASIALGSNLTLLIDKETKLLSGKTPPAPCNDTVARMSGTNCAATPPYTPMARDSSNPRCPTLYWPIYDTAVLCGSNLSNVAILGMDTNTSVVDGGGMAWNWRWTPGDKSCGSTNLGCPGGLDGPRIFEVSWSSNITLAHATFQNAANWAIHPTFSDGVLAHHIRILSPRWVGNTDGFDPDSCTDVVLHDAIIDTGDDGISIKSTNTSAEAMAARDGRHASGNIQMPAKGIHIFRTKVLSRNFCLGSATYGGIYDLLMEDCEIGDDAGSSSWAMKYKSHHDSAGAMVNHTYRRLKIGKLSPTSHTYPHGHTGFFLSIELRYGHYNPKHVCHVNEQTLEGNCPIFQNVSFEDIVIAGATRAGDINGFPGDLLRDLTFKNVTFKETKGGWSCGYTDAASFSAVDVDPPLMCHEGPAGTQARRGV